MFKLPLFIKSALEHIEFDNKTPNCLPDYFLNILGFWPSESGSGGGTICPCFMYNAYAKSFVSAPSPTTIKSLSEVYNEVILLRKDLAENVA